ncbi:MAG TPA: deoxyribodipyrimidine photo-lyase [Opitutaceae bacterium]|nr:deoxyribodipyrimidine photo-lyase [Opitutaceae bacterium]
MSTGLRRNRTAQPDREGEPRAPTLLWFRQDLRLEDNPALAAAIERGGPVIPVYILDERGEGRWAPGAASRWWLHFSLAALGESLRKAGSRLILARGDSATVLRRLARRTKASAVYWNRRHEPMAAARDRKIADEFGERGLEVRIFSSALLFEPEAIANKEGRPFQVFTPFWRHCLTQTVPDPVKCRLARIATPRPWPSSLSLKQLKLRPAIPWDAGLAAMWTPGERGARARLRRFLAQSLDSYAEERNRPDRAGSSELSPHLHWGELSPRQVWAAVKARSRDTGVFPSGNGARVFLAEIGWREFAHHLLAHFPAAPQRPLRSEFARFKWNPDPGKKAWRCWCRGRTGYPVVDAGMRQLWHTGWMHNRARMIVASFLVKDLRLAWLRGAEWFWDTLVDADLANNTLGWQWSAGCGADAAPYFRIFSPVLQGRKFDPRGDYVRRWVPELRRLEGSAVHAPWELSALELAEAGVELGRNYPNRVVDHAAARRAALLAWKVMRRKAAGSVRAELAAD